MAGISQGLMVYCEDIPFVSSFSPARFMELFCMLFSSLREVGRKEEKTVVSVCSLNVAHRPSPVCSER